jgi:hypothetical protein
MHTDNSSLRNKEAKKAYAPIDNNNNPTRFALIQIRTSDSPQKALSENLINKTKAPLSQTTQNDIAKIMMALEHRKRPYHPLPTNNTNLVIPDKTDDTDKQLINTIGMAIAGGLMGNLAGTIITNGLGLNKAAQAPKADITDRVIDIIPDLIKSFAMGTTMIAATIGMSKWLNQESPELLKVKIDALRK